MCGYAVKSKRARQLSYLVQLQSKVLKHHTNIKAFTGHWGRGQANRNYGMIRMGLKVTGAERKESWG